MSEHKERPMTLDEYLNHPAMDGFKNLGKPISAPRKRPGEK